MTVQFFERGTVDASLFRYAVIVSRMEGKWLFCKHRERDTYEVPGGTRESDEQIDDTAKRELFEETGAVDYTLIPICIYSVTRDDNTESFGMLYFAEIHRLGPLPPSEIERTELFDRLPDKLTYPLIQPKLMEKVMEFLAEKENLRL